MNQVIEELDQFLSDLSEETVLSRSRVVDRLLDLRLAADTESRALIDNVMADLPGVTMVKRADLEGELRTLRSLLEARADPSLS